MSTVAMPYELPGVRSRLQATWSAGDYDRFSRYMEADARIFYDRLEVAPGSRLLDVGCGSGQLALMAAREDIAVTGVDIAEPLIVRAQARAKAEGLAAHFQVGDAQELPFPEASFDVVVSMVGAMFAPQPDLVAAELARVCVPGGTIAMANWTPSGFIGQMFKVVSKFTAPSGVPSPVLWGDAQMVRKRLGGYVTELRCTPREYTFSYPFPPAEVVEFFRMYYGPANRAFHALDSDGQSALRQELESLWAAHNRATGDFTFVRSEYLEVIAVR